MRLLLVHTLLLVVALTLLTAVAAHGQQALSVPYTAQQLAVEQCLWDGTAWKTPYRPQLSTEEKVAGLSKFGAEAKYNFAFFNKVALSKLRRWVSIDLSSSRSEMQQTISVHI